jgi:integrase
VTAVAYQLRISDVKTGTARRTIDIDDPVVAEITAWPKRQAKERLLVGPAYEDHGLVFAKPDGRPVHPEFLSRTFDRVVRSSGLPVIRFHDIRPHATLLLKAGVQVKVVSERLGHAPGSRSTSTSTLSPACRRRRR